MIAMLNAPYVIGSYVVTLGGIALLVFGILPQYLMGLCTLAVTQSHF